MTDILDMNSLINIAPFYIVHFHYHNATSCPKSSYNGKLLIRQFCQVLLDFSECQSWLQFSFAFDKK